MRRPTKAWRRSSVCAAVAAPILLGFSPAVFAACFSPAGVESQIETFPADRMMRYCDGSSWIDMGTAGSPPAGATNPEILAIHTEMAQASDIKKVGNYIYYTDYAGRAFGIIDVSTPTDPNVVGHIQDFDQLHGAIALAIRGNYAYVVTQETSSELAVIDISDPTSPTIVAAADFAGASGKSGSSHNLRDIEIDGDYAYIATSIGLAPNLRGLLVVDLTVPTVPTQLATVDNAAMAGATQVAISGNYAYIAANSADSLSVIDITTPSAPTFSGSITNADLDIAIMVAVDGTDAYVVTEQRKLNVIDVSNPAAPSSRAVFDLLSVGALGALNSSPYKGVMALDGGMLYVAAYRTLAVVDVSDPDNPASEGFLSYLSNAHNNGVHVVVDGGHAFQISSGITVFDVSNPAVPAHSVSYWFGYGSRFTSRPVQSQASKVIDDRVYLGETTSNVNIQRLHVVDYSDPLAPVLRGSVTLNSTRPAMGFDYHDGYLFIAGQSFGFPLTVLDVRDADNPSVVAQVSNAAIDAGHNGAEEVHVDYPYAYLLGLSQKVITAFDISNPASPTKVSTYTDANFTGNMRMARYGNYFHVRSAGTNTLTVVDVSNPAAMTKRGVLSGFTNTSANGPIYADENQGEVYLAAGVGASSFQVIDATDPDAPAVKVSANITAPCSGLRLGDNLFVNRYAVIQLFDADTGAGISSLSDPSLFLSGCGDHKSIAGKYLIINQRDGIVVIDPGTDYGSEDDAARCTGPDGQLGTIHYSYAFKAARMCNGTSWVNLGPAGDGGSGGCGGAEPGVEGAIHYNTATNKYEFCEGDSWVEFD